MPVAIYARVSTEEQRERQSILTQCEFAERYCDLHGLAIYRIFLDEGVSGTVPVEARPDGSQVLRDARLGRFDQLLVFRLDRLGRETKLILQAVDELEKLGVRVKSMSEEFDTATPSGRLMLTMLSGFATHEREVIKERSVAGTQRVAEAGAWMGGIVPYAYRKVGEKRNAHLVISDDPIVGVDMSEAGVIREVFRMAAVDRSSCRVIAARLNELGVPCAYTRDDRLLLRGKRKQRTSGIWSAGRIRGLITNSTYKGLHEYGKRTRSNRPVITRDVPAIVTEVTWQKAQATLRSNLLFGKRNAKNQYLLRGLIKCAQCGKTYVGVAANRPNGKREFYYRCNGVHTPALLEGGPRCTAKSVRGDPLEQQVWADVEAFLRDPGPVLKRLHAKLEAEAAGSSDTQKKLTRLEGLLEQKATERNRVVALYRRGRLTDTELDGQMDEIGKEEAALQVQIDELRGKLGHAGTIGDTVSSAQTLLAELRTRLDEPLSWELKRQVIEVLVAGIRVETVEECGVKQSRVTVSYRFSQPDQPLPVVLPQSYGAGTAVRIPTELNTVGDHIRRRRLERKLLQREVAELIGVTAGAVFAWEGNTAAPELRYMPAIIDFLGYNPVPQPTDAAEKLVWQRTSQGLSQREAARQAGIDPSTLSRYERNEREVPGCLIETNG
jgi:site-specific DNA recombinase